MPFDGRRRYEAGTSRDDFEDDDPMTLPVPAWEQAELTFTAKHDHTRTAPGSRPAFSAASFTVLTHRWSVSGVK